MNNIAPLQRIVLKIISSYKMYFALSIATLLIWACLKHLLYAFKDNILYIISLYIVCNTMILSINVYEFLFLHTEFIL